MVCLMIHFDILQLTLLGYRGHKLIGSGGVMWDSRAEYAAGKISEGQFVQQVSLSAPR